jgi:two-component system, response regulator PdtaR
VRYLIIAFNDQDVAQKIRALLLGRGLPVRGICGTGGQVLQMAALCDGGGVVICPIRFSDMNAQELMTLLPEDFDLLVFVTPRQQDLISGSGVFTLTQPVSADMILDCARQLLETRQLRAAAMNRDTPAEAPGRPASGLAPAGRSLEEQKIIEQAKYLLMNRRKMSETEAHRYLQKKSMESGIRLAELARRIIMPA